MYKHMNLPVEDCITMEVSELQMYCKKMEGEDEEKMAEDTWNTWKRKEWQRLFRNGIPREDDNHDGEEINDDDREEEDDKYNSGEDKNDKEDGDMGVAKP
ncbi:hypothetical protein Y1Q_0015423 [Alligator mississippiensis]|uniref:Uncharacterized protein n=1 Tax=Alligator mississippiensis TaxID=8496 RepID=A0A151NCW0_ALLMI|nr:hypothetical protein Y1Q_0015423 [Alligator mississippiensis]